MEILLAFSLAIACRVLVQSLGYHMSGFLLLVVRFQTQFLLPLLYRRLLLRPRAPAEGRNQGREEDREKEKKVIHPRPKPNNPTQTPSLTHSRYPPIVVVCILYLHVMHPFFALPPNSSFMFYESLFRSLFISVIPIVVVACTLRI